MVRAVVWWLWDEVRHHGCIVNGKQINMKQPLENGDVNGCLGGENEVAAVGPGFTPGGG